MPGGLPGGMVKPRFEWYIMCVDLQQPEGSEVFIFSSLSLSIKQLDNETNFNLFQCLFISRSFSGGGWVFVTRNGRSRKLRPLEINKEKRLNSCQSHRLKCFMVTQCQTLFIGGKRQKESRYLSSSAYRCRVRWIQNWLKLEQHYSDSVSSISSVKNSPANAIKISAAIFNLLSFSLCNRHESAIY